METKKLTTFGYLGIKSKKHKKKKGGGNGKKTEGSKNENGAMVGEGTRMDEVHGGVPEPSKSSSPDTDGDDVEPPVRSQEVENRVPLVNGLSPISSSFSSTQGVDDLAQAGGFPEDRTDSSGRQGVGHPNSVPTSNGSQSEFEKNTRLDTLASERAALRAEVAQLRRSLEEVQERHEEELTSIREQLAASQHETEHAQTQYHNLLGKVNTIKSQLGERLKADAVCLHP